MKYLLVFAIITLKIRILIKWVIILCSNFLTRRHVTHLHDNFPTKLTLFPFQPPFPSAVAARS